MKTKKMTLSPPPLIFFEVWYTRSGKETKKKKVGKKFNQKVASLAVGVARSGRSFSQGDVSRMVTSLAW